MACDTEVSASTVVVSCFVETGKVVTEDGTCVEVDSNSLFIGLSPDKKKN